MLDSIAASIIAPALAAISAACFIYACFYRQFARVPFSVERSPLYRKLVKGRAHPAVPEARSMRRAHETALKSITQQGQAHRRSHLQDQLSAAGLGWSVPLYLGGCCVVAIFLFSLITQTGTSPQAAAVTACIGGWMIPQRYLSSRTERRKRAFLKSFSPAIDMIIRGAKSGLSLMDCLAMVSRDAASPAREEFQTIVAQLGAGVSLSAAMAKLARAIPAAEVRFFAMVMSVQSQTGGNLTNALTNLSTVLHQREKIAVKIQIASAEGRLSALIIGSLPFFVIGAAAAFAPDYISFLWTDPQGRKVGMLSLIWLITGIVVLLRMSRFEV